MNHTVPDVVRKLLIDLGMCPNSTTEPFSCFTYLPDTPGDCIAIGLTPGTNFGRVMMSGVVPGYYGVKFTVRNEGHDDTRGWVKANQLRDLVCETVYGNAVVLDTTTYTVKSFAKIGDVLPLGTGPDEGQLFYHTLNAEVHIQ